MIFCDVSALDSGRIGLGLFKFAVFGDHPWDFTHDGHTYVSPPPAPAISADCAGLANSSFSPQRLAITELAGLCYAIQDFHNIMNDNLVNGNVERFGHLVLITDRYSIIGSWNLILCALHREWATAVPKPMPEHGKFS